MSIHLAVGFVLATGLGVSLTALALPCLAAALLPGCDFKAVLVLGPDAHTVLHLIALGAVAVAFSTAISVLPAVLLKHALAVLEFVILAADQRLLLRRIVAGIAVDATAEFP